MQIIGPDWDLNHVVLIKQFLNPEIISEIRNHAISLLKKNEFSPAKIGRNTQSTLQSQIRGDSTFWLEHPIENPALIKYTQAMRCIMDLFNQQLFTGLIDLEAHFAFYPPGAFYRSHYDRFSDQDTRIISSVLYLNTDDWKPEDGGQLRIHLKSGPVDIQPIGGDLILFDSATVLHEVLETNRERFSLTGWYTCRPQYPDPMLVNFMEKVIPIWEQP